MSCARGEKISGLFYVILALGGALGGCFNTFIAPQIFTTAVEFPLVLSLSLLVILLPDFLSTNPLRPKFFPKITAFLLLLLLLGTTLYISSAHNLFGGWRLAVSGLFLAAILFAAFLLLDWFYQTLPRVALATLIGGLLGGHQATATTARGFTRNEISSASAGCAMTLNMPAACIPTA